MNSNILRVKLSEESQTRLNAITDRAREIVVASLPDCKDARIGVDCCYPGFDVTLEYVDEAGQQHELEIQTFPVKGWLARQLVRHSPSGVVKWKVKQLMVRIYEPFSATKHRVEVYDDFLMNDWISL